MKLEQLELPVESGRKTLARRYNAEGSPVATLILAHGAGAGQASRFMVEISSSLASRRIDVVTFDFAYMEAGRRAPDRNAALEERWKSIIEAVAAVARDPRSRLYIGGRSMGGRIASQVAADPAPLATDFAGLVFLGYPLHPPGRPSERRDRHLFEIDRPMLFVQGERDAFGSGPEIADLVSRLARAEMHIVPGANHSLETRGGSASAASFATIQDVIASWIERTTSDASGSLRR